MTEWSWWIVEKAAVWLVFVAGLYCGVGREYLAWRHRRTPPRGPRPAC